VGTLAATVQDAWWVADTEAKGKSSASVGHQAPVVQSVVRHHTDRKKRHYARALNSRITLISKQIFQTNYNGTTIYTHNYILHKTKQYNTERKQRKNLTLNFGSKQHYTKNLKPQQFTELK
jgi:hypothetical protein